MSSTTSKRRIQYRKSGWQVHEFEIWSGERICKVCVLRMDGSLLLWVGDQRMQLSDMALGVPGGQGALATALLGERESGAARLARRLAARLRRPVYVAAGLALDRLAGPLVERGLALQMKLHPCFFT